MTRCAVHGLCILSLAMISGCSLFDTSSLSVVEGTVGSSTHLHEQQISFFLADYRWVRDAPDFAYDGVYVRDHIDSAYVGQRVRIEGDVRKILRPDFSTLAEVTVRSIRVLK